MNVKSILLNFETVKRMLFFDFVENKIYNCVILVQFSLISEDAFLGSSRLISKINISSSNFIILLSELYVINYVPE